MKSESIQVVEAAFQLFKTRGLRSCSLPEVARSTGTSTRHLQELFTTKDQLVAVVVEHALEKYSGFLQVNPVLSPTAVAELHNFFKFMEKLLNEMSPQFMFEVRKYYPTAWTKIEIFINTRLIPYLQRNLARGQAEDCYRLDVHQDVYVRLYFSMLLHLADGHIYPGHTRSPLIDGLHNIFQHGILNVKGMRL